jgi:small-conductance mechanosensitive channel
MRVLIAALAVLWLGLAVAHAYDPAVVSQAELATQLLRNELQRITESLQFPTITDEQLAAHRRDLEDIRAKALLQSQTLDEPIAEVNQQLAGLGEPPPEGAEEAPAIAEQRKTLTETLKNLQGVKSQLDVTAVEAEQLSGRTSLSNTNPRVGPCFSSIRPSSAAG